MRCEATIFWARVLFFKFYFQNLKNDTLAFLDFSGCRAVDVKVEQWLKTILCGENAVASSKNNAGASELVFGDEILDGLKVEGLQMILIGLK